MKPHKLIAEEYRRQRRLAFQWGATDCLTWAADCAHALTGSDPMGWLRGRYRTPVGARRVMKAEGWQDMADVARSMYPEIPVSQARTGDWAHVVNEDGTDTLGVVVRDMICARTEDRGLGQVPLARASTAFRVT